MKKQLGKTLRLRKDTLQSLGQDAMSKVVGGTSGHPICNEHTENAVCVATTLAPNCAHHPTTDEETMGCSAQCSGLPNCTQICSIGCNTLLGPTTCN